MEANNHEEMVERFQTLLVACHATTPHCAHRLEFNLDGKPVEGVYELHIRCLHKACKDAGVEVKWMVPTYMVGAAALVFHSSHEGHRLVIAYRDIEIVSPKSAELKASRKK